MAGRNPLVVLAEIEAAIDGIEQAVDGRTIDDFSADWLLKHGVERGLEIISEASRHIPEELLAVAPEIPWKQMRGIGNVFRHEYHKVANPIIWAVVKDNLPPLRLAVRRMHDAVSSRAG